MLPTLAAVQELGGSTSKSELEQEVATKVELTDEQLAVVFPQASRNPGRSKVMYELAWARSTLKAIGALDNSTRSVWSVTPKGLKYLEMTPSAGVEALKEEARAARNVQIARKVALAESASVPGITEDQDGGLDPGEPTDDWRVTLIDALKKMEPAAFEL